MIDRPRQARLELVFLAVVVVALSRLVSGPPAWLVAGLVLAMMVVGSMRVFGPDTARRSLESAVTPAVAAIACLGALRLVPVGLGLVPALLAVGALVDGALALESRIRDQPKGATASDHLLLLALSVLLAFLAFTGVAALVPGGLVEPGSAGVPRVPLPETALAALAVADAFVAFLLGHRLSALRTTRPRDALVGAAGYALAIAITAGLVRAAALPRLLGPALLTLVFFLWDAFRGTEPAARRDPRFVWQVALLAVLGAVVVGWNLMLRG